MAGLAVTGVRRAIPSALALGICGVLAGSPAGMDAATRAPAPAASSGTLAVERGGAWATWWRAGQAPERWRASLPVVAGAVSWRSASRGVDWGALRLSGTGEAWRIRVILARFDPHRVQLTLDTARAAHGLRADWTIDRAPSNAVLALNTGQFTGSFPWGWVVLNGGQFLPPQHGPLSTAVVIDSSGSVRLMPPESIPALLAARGIASAFQSYPTLLTGDGNVPLALRPVHDTKASGGINLTHRDARLAIGTLRDGRVLIALTRFDGLDGALDFVPFGLTVPEMAAVMGALGCQRAVMLDGGISSQLLIRELDGTTHRWPGIRRVPLGLVAVPRPE